MFGKDGPTLFELLHQALVSTRHGYDLLAPKFDVTPFRTPDEILVPAISAVGSVDTALDVCCGTGAAMMHLKPHCGQRLVGVDFSSAMLRKAAEHMADIPGSARVEFVEADALAMTFDAEFDVVTCFGALGHILPKDQPAFLRGIRRALKPGGRFVFVTVPHPKMFSRANILYRSFDTIMAIRNALIRPPFIMYYLNFLLPEIEVLLKKEGFEVEVRRDVFEAPFGRACLVIATRTERNGSGNG